MTALESAIGLVTLLGPLVGATLRCYLDGTAIVDVSHADGEAVVGVGYWFHPDDAPTNWDANWIEALRCHVGPRDVDPCGDPPQ